MRSRMQRLQHRHLRKGPHRQSLPSLVQQSARCIQHIHSPAGHISYIFNHDEGKTQALETLGYDLDTYMLVYKEAFALVGELGYSNKEAAEFIFRLKNAYDSSQGRPVDPTASLSDPVPTSFPQRVSVESNARPFFFRLLPCQTQVDRNSVLYRCEHCFEPTRRMDVKQHVLERHEVET